MAGVVLPAEPTRPVESSLAPESASEKLPVKKRARSVETKCLEEGIAPQTSDEPRRKRGRPRKQPVAATVDLTASTTIECSDQHPACQRTLQRLRDRIQTLSCELESTKTAHREAIARCDHFQRVVTDTHDYMRTHYGYVPDY